MAPVHLPLSCYQVRPPNFNHPGSFVEVGGAVDCLVPLRLVHRTLTLTPGAATNSV